MFKSRLFGINHNSIAVGNIAFNTCAVNCLEDIWCVNIFVNSNYRTLLGLYPRFTAVGTVIVTDTWNCLIKYAHTKLNTVSTPSAECTLKINTDNRLGFIDFHFEIILSNGFIISIWNSFKFIIPFALIFNGNGITVYLSPVWTVNAVVISVNSRISSWRKFDCNIFWSPGIAFVSFFSGFGSNDNIGRGLLIDNITVI